MKRMYPNYQYIIATHVDRGHIHNHILINSVNFEDYHKLHSNKNTLEELREKSNDISRENGLSVIEKDSLNHKQRLKQNIDKAIEKAADLFALRYAAFNRDFEIFPELKTAETNIP